MRSTVSRPASALVVAACVCVLAAFPVRAQAASEGRGDATAANTVFSMTIGSSAVQLGVDTVSSTWSATRTASAEMLLGRAGDQSIQGAKKVSTSRADSGSAIIAQRTVDVGTSSTLSVASGSVAAFVVPDHVASSVDLTAGSLGLFKDLVDVGSAGIHTITRVESTQATVTRTVTLGQASMLGLGDLLRRFGVDPLSLACDAIEKAGANLGAATSSACEELAAAHAAVDTAKAALDKEQAVIQALVTGFTLSQVQADAATLSALDCDPLDVVCRAAALVQMATLDSSGGYGVDLTGLDFDTAKAAMLARLADLESDLANLDIVNDGIAKSASGTCADVAGALGDVATGIPSLAATLDPLAGTASDACAALASTVTTLMDTPLVTLGAINVSLDTVATVRSPSAHVTGTLGALKVGSLEPVGATLSLTQADFNDKVARVRAKLGDALGALGIGLPSPEVELMKTAVSKGKRADGTWFASASLTALHLRMPSVTLSLPSTDPLAILAGSSQFAAVRPARMMHPVRAAQTSPVTPEVVVDAAKFTGQSTFHPGEDGTTLPITGIADGPGIAVFAMVLFSGAAWLRRFLLAR